MSGNYFNNISTVSLTGFIIPLGPGNDKRLLKNYAEKVRGH